MQAAVSAVAVQEGRTFRNLAPVARAWESSQAAALPVVPKEPSAARRMLPAVPKKLPAAQKKPKRLLPSNGLLLRVI